MDDMHRRPVIGLAAAAAFILGGTWHAAAADNRVLIIGIDGAGGSYLPAANTPNIDALAAAGAARYDFLNEAALVANPPEGYGASGANWSTIATGALAAHHGVSDNSFSGSRYDQYPHFYQYVEQQKPQLFTASIVDWSPINDFILGDTPADLSIGGISDNAVRDVTVNLLQTGDPHAIFLHFDQVDAAGHGVGWGTSAYYNAIANVDGLIGNILTALNSRPGVLSGTEDWLVTVTSDHGGQSTSHFASQGLINWQVPMVLSGPSVPDGAPLKQGTLRDVAATALWHLGIDPFGTAVDGRVIGIPFGPPNGVIGDVNQDGLVIGDGTGPAASDDVTAFVAGWMTRGHQSAPAAYMHGDLNLDRVTDLRDWIILNRLNPAMGQAVLHSLAVPEPAGAMLLVAGGALAWSHGRRAVGGFRTLRRRGRLTALAAVCLAAALLRGQSRCRAALTDELVGLYQFEDSFLDGSGSPVASHGIAVNGPQFTTGKIGKAMYLPGVRDYMSLPATAELDFGTTTDFTFSMWIRQDDFLSDPAVLSNKDWDSGDNTGINWAVKGNGIFDLNTKGSGGARRDLDTAANSGQLPVGAWSHVAMTVDRDGATRLYINGINTGTVPVTSQGSFNGSLPWNIGQDGTGQYGVEFTGAVDELAVWRRALSGAEASQLYNNGNGLDLAPLIVDSRLKLVIDRNTGDVTLRNNTGQSQSVIGYQITSSAGALRPASWTPIAGRLDSTGDGSVDADDRWVVLTHSSSSSDLSEASLGTATLAPGARIPLGQGVWTRYFEDVGDIEFLYADGVGDEPLAGLVEFTGNGGAAFLRGDLNFDGFLDSDDWSLLARVMGSDLAGLSAAGRYRRGDLSGDGAYSLDDVLAFRQQFDAVNGPGAFAAMLAVPEPAAVHLAGWASLVWWRLRDAGRRVARRAAAAVAVLTVAAIAVPRGNAATLFQEDFDAVVLGPKIDEGTAGASVWSNAPPAGWSIDSTGVPAGGVAEWRGWAFADPTWWATTAADQGRSQFTKASGVVAVADPDEWDDLPRSPGTYNSFLRTPSIPLAGTPAGAARLRFDSSWLPEDGQTAVVAASYDGGAPVELARWTSAAGDNNFKPGATNETVVLPLNNPPGAASVAVSFGMVNAENDWWWAIDNVEVFTPLALRVDVQSGAMQISGDSGVSISEYEIRSAGGSLNAAAWRAGNLDAQNVGVPTAAAADFNGGGVAADDLATWKAAYGAAASGDADRDGDSDGADFLRWQRQYGATSDAASGWLTMLGTNAQLIEAYLLGATALAADMALGAGYNPAVDARDLVFTYASAEGEATAGFVTYVNLPSAHPAPEPRGIALGMIAAGLAAWRRRR
ncbi:MAG: hypothetical protein DCC67_11915 [Planctomycetota bacterium]|nr:MAG: hypothetical protein DCC67_11915 [Planctomycetota bacterium]